MIPVYLLNTLDADRREAFEERAAIMEFCGNQPRHLAEHHAFLRCADDVTRGRYAETRQTKLEL